MTEAEVKACHRVEHEAPRYGTAQTSGATHYVVLYVYY